MINNLKKRSTWIFFIILFLFFAKTFSVSAVYFDVTKSYQLHTVLLDEDEQSIELVPEAGVSASPTAAVTDSPDTSSISNSNFLFSRDPSIGLDNKKIGFWAKLANWFDQKIIEPSQNFFNKVGKNAANSKVVKFVNQQKERLNTFVSQKVTTFKEKINARTLNVKNMGSMDELDQLIPKYPEIRREKKIQYLNNRYDVKVMDGNIDWSEQELKWLGETLVMVPKEFYARKGWQKLKIKRKDVFIDPKTKKPSNNTCGLTHEYIIHSIIVFNSTDKCLQGREMPDEYLDIDGNVDYSYQKSKEASYKLVYTHELAHAYDNNGHEKNKENFIKLSWDLSIKQVVEYQLINGKKTYLGITDIATENKKNSFLDFAIEKANPESYVSNYGGSEYSIKINGIEHFYSRKIGQPDEDYAESVAFYTLFPSKLKQISSAKYDFIKDNIYNGKEFSDVK